MGGAGGVRKGPYVRNTAFLTRTLTTQFRSIQTQKRGKEFKRFDIICASKSTERKITYKNKLYNEFK